jgi:hypothetical protein
MLFQKVWAHRVVTRDCLSFLKLSRAKVFSLKIAVFWDVTPCDLLDVYKHFSPPLRWRFATQSSSHLRHDRKSNGLLNFHFLYTFPNRAEQHSGPSQMTACSSPGGSRRSVRLLVGRIKRVHSNREDLLLYSKREAEWLACEFSHMHDT